MHQIQINGRSIAYHDRGSGQPVVLLHPGFIADAMLPLLDQPALAGYRLIAPHRRGYGRSDRAQPPVSIAEQSSDVIGVLDALGIERAHLVGHSFGGCVALEVAHSHAERVGRLALLEPPLGFMLSQTSLGVLMATAGEAMQHFASGDHARAVAVWLDAAFGPDWQRQVEHTLSGAVAQATADAPAAFGIEVPSLQAWPFGPPDLAAIQAPMLSVAHTDAWEGFSDVHRGLVAAGAEAAVVPVASHLLQIIDAPSVAEALGAFLAARARSAAAAPAPARS